MSTPRQPRVVRFGAFEADLHSSELRKQGLRIKLQIQPFQVLAMLLERPGELVTREELRERLWPADTFVDFDHGLNAAINKLREALNDSAEAPRFIETLPRRGYRFIATVEETAPPSEPKVVVEAPAPPGVVVNVREEKPHPQREKRRWVITISVLTTAVLAVTGAGFVGVFMLSTKSTESVVGISEGKGGAPRIESLAVLPLKNLSGDAAQAYFAEGMTDALITNLAKIASLRVISRTSVMQYQEPRQALPEIAERLRVDGIVEGTVQRSGDTVRIRVALLHGPTDRHLWAGEYEGDLSDILTLQARLAREIAQEIRVTLTPEEQTHLATRSKVDPAVYELYLRARHHWNQRTREGLLKSRELFEQAIARKPDFAEAYAGLADAYNTLALHDYLPPREAYPKATAAATRALALDATLADAYAARGLAKMWYEWDWKGAEADFARALRLNPGSAVAHHRYGLYLAALGRHPEALPELEKSRGLDPLSPVLNAALGDGYLLARQYERAVEQYRKTLEIDANYRGARANLAWALAHLKRYAEALEIFRELDEKPALAYVHAVAGRPEEARRILGELPPAGVSPYDLALVHAALGNKDRAMQLLEAAYAGRSIYLVQLGVDPALDPLRSDPRFRALAGRVGLPAETPKTNP